MSNKYWTREDVHQWWKDQYKDVLLECGCEEEDHSIHGDGMYQPDFSPDVLQDEVLKLNGHDTVQCPETYGKVADAVCSDPHAALQAIRPIMQQIGIGCPQSFAKALFDIFSVGQDMGIIKPFNVDEII
tara:strand:+ start:912 stop:1298 length:387 start_codon:yes stop_codon:yes gene_type:complete